MPLVHMADSVLAGLSGWGSAAFAGLRTLQRRHSWQRYGRTRCLRLRWSFACDSYFASLQLTALRLGRQDL